MAKKTTKKKTGNRNGTEKKRGPKGPHGGMFKPGQSGNPSGRPKSDHRIMDLARAHTESAINTLIEIMKDPYARESARVKAAEVILNRGWGCAPQSVDMTTAGEKMENRIVILEIPDNGRDKKNG